MALESTRISTSNCPSLAGTLSIPLLTCLTEQEQSKLVTLPNVFYSKSGLFLYRALNWIIKKLPDSTSILPARSGVRTEWLDGFHEVLIYPAPFVVDDNGKTISVWCITNVLFSQVRAAARAYRFELVGYTRFFWCFCFNLIIHEVAHKLDTRNGDRPAEFPLFRCVRLLAGNTIFICNEQHSGRNRISWRECGEHHAYAASDPAECFAVLSEYFFAPQNFLLLVSLHCGNVSANLSTRSFAETASR